MARGNIHTPYPRQAAAWGLSGERCQVTPAHSAGNLIATSSGTVVAGHFETGISSNGRKLTPPRGESEVLTLNFKIKINGGPEREIQPYSGMRVEVYNGFRALPPIAIEVKNNPFIVAGQFISLLAVIYPNPALDAGFSYEWFAVKVGGGQGDVIFNQDGVPSNMTRFSASCPGDYNVYYRVTFGGETETSGSLKIKVGPEIFIDNPVEDNQKYCFNHNGELIILAEGHTNPEASGEDLQWSIRVPEGTNMTSTPGDEEGTAVVYRFNGMPPSNDEFGNFNSRNWIKATIPIENCTAELSRPIMLFYISGAYYLEDDGHRVPNWYHYWKQGTVINLSYLSYTETEPTGAYQFRGMNEFGYPIEAIYIGFNGDAEGADFGRIPGFPNYDIPAGIDNAANICKHELTHKFFYHQWMPPDGEWYIRFGEHPVIRNPRTTNRKANPNDKDGDLIPNEIELEYNRQYAGNFKLHLRTNNENSYGLPNYPSNGDQEIMCIIAAWNQTGDASKDWSRGRFAKNWPLGN